MTCTSTPFFGSAECLKTWAPWEAITHPSRWINDAGEIVGRADLYPGLNIRHGFLWKNGVMTDLGIVTGDPCSTAYRRSIRASKLWAFRQSVDSPAMGSCGRTEVPWSTCKRWFFPALTVTIQEVYFINDAGEISGFGTRFHW